MGARLALLPPNTAPLPPHATYPRGTVGAAVPRQQQHCSLGDQCDGWGHHHLAGHHRAVQPRACPCAWAASSAAHLGMPSVAGDVEGRRRGTQGGMLGSMLGSMVVGSSYLNIRQLGSVLAPYTTRATSASAPAHPLRAVREDETTWEDKGAGFARWVARLQAAGLHAGHGRQARNAPHAHMRHMHHRPAQCCYMSQAFCSIP